MSLNTMDYDSYEDDELLKIEESQDANNDEETDDASETEKTKVEEGSTEIKEHMYRMKLSQLKEQLQQLKNGTLNEYCKRLKKLQLQQKERHKHLSVWQSHMINLIENEFEKARDTAIDEFQNKKVELKENLILELQEKQKNLECEKLNAELTGGCLSLSETKTHVTRKLRRRPNDPLPANNDKRRKASPTQINFMLNDEEIESDLALLNKGRSLTTHHSTDSPNYGSSDVRIESGKLFYNKKWFHRCQPIYAYSQKENIKFSAIISSISERELLVKKISDGTKTRIYVSQLAKGRYTISNRAMQ